MKHVFVCSVFEAVLAEAAKRPPGNEDSLSRLARQSLGDLRFVTFPVRSARTAFAVAILILVASHNARAQSANDPTPDDAFAAHRWHVEFSLQASLEAWNYNVSHEELYGLQEGVTYGLRDGLVLLARQRTYYVSQRGNDTWVLALTGGLRARVYRRGRASAFLQFDMGVSDAAIALPSRGTRFNYLGVGGDGVLVRLRPRLHLVTSLDLLHISNASVKGPDRNPDIESIGPTLGLIVGF